MSTWRAIDTITRQLELCLARPGETAAVISTDIDDDELRRLVAMCLERLGCRVNELIVRSGVMLDGEDPVDNEAVAAALLHSDLVVDVHGSLVRSSTTCTELLDEARVLALDVASLADLDHLVSHPGLARRVDKAEQLLAAGSNLTLESDAGTDIEFSISEAEVSADAGLATKVGDLATWPAGIVWVDLERSAAVGSVVAMPGDLLIEDRHVLRSPVRMEIESGHVAEVHGDSGDGDVIRSHLEALSTEDAYLLGSVGWGMNLTRGAGALTLFDPARLDVGRGPLSAGLVNVRLGPPPSSLTIGLAHTTIRIDGQVVVAAGDLDAALAPDIYERAAGA